MKHIVTSERLLQVLIVFACLTVLTFRFVTIDIHAQTSCNGSPELMLNYQMRSWAQGKNIAVTIFEKSTGAETSENEFSAIDGAIRAWNTIKVSGCSNVTFGNATRAGRIWDPAESIPNDTIFVVRTMDRPGQWEGIFSSSVMRAGRAYLRSDYTHTHVPSGQGPLYRVDNLAKHEVGHSFGVTEGGSAAAAMNPNPIWGSFDSGNTLLISACDADAHRRVYCPAPTPTPSPTPEPPPECDPSLPSYCWDVFCTQIDPNDCNRCLPFHPGECGSPQAGCNCSPIIIDIDGDGFALTNASDGVEFDLNGDGVFQSRLGWTAPGSDDAWLVLDRNANGTIDSGEEMFGNYTPQPPATERHGFLALAEFDKAENGGNSDGKINRQDGIFTSLRLWQDTNQNGVSESNELHRLRSLGLAAIDLDFATSRRVDQHGNRFKYRSRIRDINGVQLGRWAWDVFLVAESINNVTVAQKVSIFSFVRPKCRVAERASL